MHPRIRILDIPSRAEDPRPADAPTLPRPREIERALRAAGLSRTQAKALISGGLAAVRTLAPANPEAQEPTRT